MNQLIDLRSDTVTQPTEAMLDVMRGAETGDDVYGEDPTVNELEAYAAELTGKQAALYSVSGTQSNLLALLSHCQRGEEYIAGATAHTYMFEGGGAAALGGIQPCTLAFNDRGELPLSELSSLIKPDDFHFAKTRLLCLENTQSGKVLSMSYLESFSELALARGLSRHLDGARAFNAAVKLNLPIAKICEQFDSVSLCLSKGLGCPVGAILVGDHDFIRQARRYRKMIGGGMRQAGVIAAAGLYALRHNIDRLGEDHALANKLAEAIAELPGLGLAEAPETNMVILKAEVDIRGLKSYLGENGVKISGPRMVFHQDISSDDVDRLITLCQAFQTKS